jgi:hypothetical protein
MNATGIVVNGKAVLVPGVTVHNFLDDPALKLAEYDGRPRQTTWVRNIVLHCTVGDAQTVIQGSGPSELWWHRYPDIWASDRKPSTKDAQGHVVPGARLIHGGHGVIDKDGVVGWYDDALTAHTYHCGQVNNEYSVGIELKQGDHGEVYQVEIDVAVTVVWALCCALGIQFQVHLPYHGAVSRLSDGRDVVGIIGHRDCDPLRGAGDPGNAVLNALVAHGAERFDFAAGEDLAAWRRRQGTLNKGGAALTVDGVAGPATCAVLRAQAHPFGLWAQYR